MLDRRRPLDVRERDEDDPFDLGLQRSAEKV
jgi:hypothetical protein